MIAEYSGMIKIPATRDFYMRAKPYNYLKSNDEIYFGVRGTPDDNYFLLPRDIIKFTKLFPEFDIEYTTIAPKVEKVVKLTNLELRKYQESVAQQVQNFWKQGFNDILLHAETGFGKTFIVPYFIEKLQLKTAIIVDKTLLAKQMYDEILENSDANVSILSKNSKLTDVNIATYQLLMKNENMLEELQVNTGFLIMDEVHIAAANSLVGVTSGFSAKYRLGLSATPTRSDGLTGLVYDLFGRSIVKGENPSGLVVHIHKVEYDDIFYSGVENYKKKLAHFLEGHYRTVVPLVDKFLKNGRKVCIACDIQHTQEYYQKQLIANGISAEILNSNASAKDRERILKLFDADNLDVILGFAILEKGISIPRMDTIIHLSGAVTKEKIVQLVGRLRREDNRKKLPIFVDLQFKGSLEKQQNIREHTYLTLKDKVKTFSFSDIDTYIGKIK